MKKTVMGFIFVASLGCSETLYVNEYANKDRKNPEDATRSGVNGNIDIGYTSYLIDISSSELSRAIDYNILEATVGVSYAYANWIWGIDTKVLVQEQSSNLTYSSRKSNDSANIKRNEFLLFTNYKISKQFRVNLVYRYANLKSDNSYVDFKKYDTFFNYTTNGLAASLVYSPTMINGLFFSTGTVYSKADVEVYEKVNNIADDVSIDDSSSSLGVKLGVGYNYAVNNDIVLKLSADWYKFNFGKLNIYSNSLGRDFEQASLDEETYSIRFGMAYQF